MLVHFIRIGEQAWILAEAAPGRHHRRLVVLSASSRRLAAWRRSKHVVDAAELFIAFRLFLRLLLQLWRILRLFEGVPAPFVWQCGGFDRRRQVFAFVQFQVGSVRFRQVLNEFDDGLEGLQIVIVLTV